MNIKNIKYKLNSHFQASFWLYAISILCFSLGLVIGMYTVKYMNNFEKTDLTSYLNVATKSSGIANLNYKSILIEVIKNNMPIILLLWFLGLTLIGIPVILVIDVLKGFTIGFTSTFFVNAMGIKGILMSLLAVMPQNIIYIPCIIICSVVAMEFSITTLKNNIKKSKGMNIHSKVVVYSVIFFVMSLIMVFGFAFETYITPSVIKVIASNTGSILFE